MLTVLLFRASIKGRNLTYVPVRRFLKPLFTRIHFVLRLVRSYILAIFWYFLGPTSVVSISQPWPCWDSSSLALTFLSFSRSLFAVSDPNREFSPISSVSGKKSWQLFHLQIFEFLLLQGTLQSNLAFCKGHEWFWPNRPLWLSLAFLFQSPSSKWPTFHSWSIQPLDEPCHWNWASFWMHTC